MFQRIAERMTKELTDTFHNLCVLVPAVAGATIQRRGQISVSKSRLFGLSTQTVHELSSSCRGNLALSQKSSSTSPRRCSLHVVAATWPRQFSCWANVILTFFGNHSQVLLLVGPTYGRSSQAVSVAIQGLATKTVLGRAEGRKSRKVPASRSASTPGLNFLWDAPAIPCQVVTA